jgi:hypothetical protein
MSNLLDTLWKFLKRNKPKWNHGHCSECGCKWEYFSHSRPGYILYTCENGHHIERAAPDADPNTTDIQKF